MLTLRFLMWCFSINISMYIHPGIVFFFDSIGNFKAVYQRARAHAALCNEEEARRDFNTVEKLDPNFKPCVKQELKKLGEAMRSVHTNQNKTYWDMVEEKWGPDGSKVKGKGRKMKTSQKGKTEGDKKRESEREDEGGEREKSPESGGAAVREDELGTTDNPAADKDGDPAPTGLSEDNTTSETSADDEGEKVKLQSGAAQEPGSARRANKAAEDKPGNCDSVSE